MRKILLPAILAAVVGLAYLPTQAHASVHVAPVYFAASRTTRQLFRVRPGRTTWHKHLRLRYARGGLRAAGTLRSCDT